MTRLCLLVFFVCLYVASITCTDEKSSRGEPLKGISNDVLAKLNSDQDLERFYLDAFESGLTLESRLEEWAEFSKNKSKSYPALLKRLKNVAKILSSDPFFVKFWDVIMKNEKSTRQSSSAIELFLRKNLLSNEPLTRKIKDILSKALESDPDLKQLWENAMAKGLSEASSDEEWNIYFEGAKKSNQAVEAKLNKFVLNSMRSVHSMLIVYTAFGDDLETNGAYQPTIYIAYFIGTMLVQYCYKIYFF